MAKQQKFDCPQNRTLEAIQQLIPDSKFTTVAKDKNGFAGLAFGSSWIGIEPGLLRVQWERADYRGADYWDIKIPAFNNPKWDAKKVVDLAQRINVRREEISTLTEKLENESETETQNLFK
jgi:hypothetical protein